MTGFQIVGWQSKLDEGPQVIDWYTEEDSALLEAWCKRFEGGILPRIYLTFNSREEAERVGIRFSTFHGSPDDEDGVEDDF